MPTTTSNRAPPPPGQGRRQDTARGARAAPAARHQAEIEAAYQAELAELHRVYVQHVAQIDAQLRDIDHGLAPQPPRDEAD